MSAAPATRQLPAHTTSVLAPRRTRHCVCIPVLNEAAHLPAQLARMVGIAGMPDVVVADGGSTDGGADPERLRAAGVRALLVKTGPGRLGAQIRMGFAWALDEGYQGVILIDGNGKDDPAAVPEFARALDEGWDFLQGSRFVPGGRAVNTPLLRLLGIRLVHAPLVSLAARTRYTDTTNGFRACSRRLLEDQRVAIFRDALSGYELHYYLAIRAARLGFRVKEIPVTRTYPPEGRIPTKISPLRGNLNVLRALVAACLGRYDP